MTKTILAAFSIAIFLVSCTSFKPLSISGNKQVPASTSDDKKEIKFLDINSTDDDIVAPSETKSNAHKPGSSSAHSPGTNDRDNRSADAARIYSLQLKYSQLLNTNADQVQNFPLYQNIDDWYGTRYKFGGTTKDGIDCSAFVQTIFISAFGITLPRTARDQYKFTKRISRTELKEGDLLFFNTRGGVSHVGIYLQNNKFVHASVSGVMISDMFEPYYVKHFVAAGRVTNLNSNSTTSLRP